MQENETASLEKGIDTKNNLIETLADKTSERTKEISGLQDEVLSLKVNNCRIGSQQQNITKENDQAKTKKKDDSQAATGSESRAAEKQYNEVDKERNHRSD